MGDLSFEPSDTMSLTCSNVIILVIFWRYCKNIFSALGFGAPWTSPVKVSKKNILMKQK